MPDYYKILKINENATPAEIKKAYRSLAILYHPDKNPEDVKGAEEKFKELNAAYEVLSNPDKRIIYDSTRRAASNPSHSNAHWFYGSAQFDFDHFGSPPPPPKPKREYLDGLFQDVFLNMPEVANQLRSQSADDIWDLVLGSLLYEFILIRTLIHEIEHATQGQNKKLKNFLLKKLFSSPPLETDNISLIEYIIDADKKSLASNRCHNFALKFVQAYMENLQNDAVKLNDFAIKHFLSADKTTIQYDKLRDFCQQYKLTHFFKHLFNIEYIRKVIVLHFKNNFPLFIQELDKLQKVSDESALLLFENTIGNTKNCSYLFSGVPFKEVENLFETHFMSTYGSINSSRLPLLIKVSLNLYLCENAQERQQRLFFMKSDTGIKRAKFLLRLTETLFANKTKSSETSLIAIALLDVIVQSCGNHLTTMLARTLDYDSPSEFAWGIQNTNNKLQTNLASWVNPVIKNELINYIKKADFSGDKVNYFKEQFLALTQSFKSVARM